MNIKMLSLSIVFATFARLVLICAIEPVSVIFSTFMVDFTVQSVWGSDKISGDPAQPKRHFRPHEVIDLDESEALRSYDKLKETMSEAYKLSRQDTSKIYQTWRKINRVPFQSATHGRRYVNTYVNPAGAEYGQLKEDEKMPRGSVIAKDSFTTVKNGGVFPGPLFIMEKMQAGFNYVSGDWRYTMIMPDGSLYGVTNGEGAKRVEFCIGCHLTREKYDHLYLVPPEYRAD